MCSVFVFLQAHEIGQVFFFFYLFVSSIAYKHNLVCGMFLRRSAQYKTSFALFCAPRKCS